MLARAYFVNSEGSKWPTKLSNGNSKGVPFPMTVAPSTTIDQAAGPSILRATFLVVLGLAAGAAGSFLYLKYENQFGSAQVKGLSGEALGARLIDESDKAKLKSNAFNGAILGATVAGMFGIGVGIVRGSLARVLLGGVLGTALGAGLGATTGIAVYRLYSHFISVNLAGMTRSLGMQATFWGPLGLATCAAALIAGARPAWRVATAIFVAVCLVCLLTPLIGIAASMSYSDQIPPRDAIQLYFSLIGGGGALGAALAWNETMHGARLSTTNSVSP